MLEDSNVEVRSAATLFLKSVIDSCGAEALYQLVGELKDTIKEKLEKLIGKPMELVP